MFFGRTGFNLSVFGYSANHKPNPDRLKPVLLESLGSGDLLRKMAGDETSPNRT